MVYKVSGEEVIDVNVEILAKLQLRCLQPYYAESTSSRLITEVKQRRAGLVLGWVTAWEYPVL